MSAYIDTNSIRKYVNRKLGRRSTAATLGSDLAKIGALIGVAAAAGVVARGIYRYVQSQRELAKSKGRVESVHDKTLKDSFPASDPPASQFFEIPVNRQ
jgi:hypothetical protein